MKKFRWLIISAAVLSGVAAFFIVDDRARAAACAPTTDYGSATITVNIPATGTYLVLSRMMADSATTSNNSYYLEIDGNTCLVIGDHSSVSGSAWTWVNYKDGNTSSSALHNFSSTGNHTIKLIGREPNVKLDRVIFTQDLSCVPTGTGDNCASPVDPVDTQSPSVSVSAPTNGSSVNGTINLTASATDNVGVTKVEFYVDNVLKGTDTSSPFSLSFNTFTLTNGTHTITAKAFDAADNSNISGGVNVTVNNPAIRPEDINQDGVVNLLDFSLLASKFGQSGGTIGRSDINQDGVVNLLDFSLLASKFGT